MADLYRHKEGNSQVQCVQHDGTQERADAITAWIESDAGDTHARAMARGTVDYDLHNAYILLEHELKSEFVVPFDWVIRARPGRFYITDSKRFEKLYERVA